MRASAAGSSSPDQISLHSLPVASSRRSFQSMPGPYQEALHLIASLLGPCLGSTPSRQVAKRLLEEFGSVSAVLAAPTHRLTETRGVGEATARHLTNIFHAAQYVAAERVDSTKPILSSSSALLDYCRLQMAFLPVEQFRVLFLDKRNRLIADEVQQTGTVDHTPAYPREVVRRALELGATALILVHNHPSGDLTPSSSDLRITKEIGEVVKLFNITLHDHLIVGRSGHVGLRNIMSMG